MLAQAALRGVPAPSPWFDLVAEGAIVAPAAFARASTATLWDGTSLASYGVDSARFTASDALVIEDGATNQLLNSETMGAASWSRSGVTITTDATPAPDGATTAEKLVEATNTGIHQLFHAAISFTSGTTYVFSLFAKAAERDSFLLTFPNTPFPDNSVGQFDLSTQTATPRNATASVAIEPLTNGWFRCILIATADATLSNHPAIWLRNGGESYTGDGSSGLFIWGAQLEVGPRKTSYIPTASSSASRAGDALTWTPTAPHTIALTGSAADGTVYPAAAPLIQSAPALTPWSAPAGRWSAVRARAA